MKTIEQIRHGLTMYLDQEILPRMSGVTKWAAMMYLALVMDNFEKVVHDTLSKPALSMLGIMCDDGMVDVKRLYKAAADAWHEDIGIDFPVVGRITFNKHDLDTLYNMIQCA